MAGELPYMPPPPSPENDDKQKKPDPPGGGLTLSPKVVIDLARMYQTYRLIIGMAAKFAHQRIPPELDQAMRAVAATGDPEALRQLQEEEERREIVPMQQGPQGTYEVPPDSPGAPVMTEDMAEEAYFLHREKHMGTLAIAQYFTERGSPVSKATVTRYIDDMRQKYEELEEDAKRAFARRVQLGIFTAALWFVSAVGLHYLFDFLHWF